MDEKKKMLLADFALLLAATFWGMGFVAGDMAAKAFPTFWIMTVRFLGAAVWMGLLFRRAVKSSTKEDIKAGMILGGLLFLAQPLQIIALRYTTPSKQAFLVTTYVIIVPFISWLVLRKRPQNKGFCRRGNGAFRNWADFSERFSACGIGGCTFAAVCTGVFVSDCGNGDLCEEGEPSGNVLLSISDSRRIFPYHNADSGGNAAGVSACRCGCDGISDDCEYGWGVYPTEYCAEIYLRYPFGGAAFHGIGDWVFLRRGAVWRSLYHARADWGIDCVWRGAAFGAELEGNI